jgi:CHC2 zinc finger
MLEFDLTRRHEVDQLVGDLPDPPGKPPRGRDLGQRRAWHPLDRALLAIPAERYVQELAGIRPSRAGKLCCPFHDDHNPSLQLYEDGGWYCFGCRQGGTIYDFAALLWSAGTKDRAFLRLRARLAAELGVHSHA